MKSKGLAGIILIALIMLFATSCEKDDSSPEKRNSIKMDGSDFFVISASMMGVSIGDDGHTGITFMSGTLTRANTLTIDVESFTKEGIEGEYAFPEVSGKKLLDDWLTSYSVFEGSSMTSSNLESGEVSIINNGGNNYTVEMSLTMADGVSFAGEYTGEFLVMFNNQ